METIGDKIYKLRRQNGISQEELGYRVAVSRQTVSKWEANVMRPNSDKLKKLCEEFGVTSDYFLFDEEDKAAAAEESPKPDEHASDGTSAREALDLIQSQEDAPSEQGAGTLPSKGQSKKRKTLIQKLKKFILLDCFLFTIDLVFIIMSVVYRPDIDIAYEDIMIKIISFDIYNVKLIFALAVLISIVTVVALSLLTAIIVVIKCDKIQSLKY